MMTQTKTCLHCSSSFTITQDDLDFYNKISPTFAGEKFQIPTPTLCPDCRQRRRLSFRNERSLYRRTCDASGKQIISIYSPDKPYKVYDQKIWRSDSWDPMSYGRDFDFTKSFAEQFGELMREVPRLALQIKDSDNSGYTNLSIGIKDSYLSFGCENGDEYMYSTFAFNSNYVFDSYRVFDSSKVFNSFCVEKSNSVFGSTNVTNCDTCFYCNDCIGCSFCIDCCGLENQSYCFRNEKLSKEEFMKIKEDVSIDWNIKPGEHGVFRNNITSSGARMHDSKSCYQCTWCGESNNCSYCSLLSGLNDSYDSNHAGFNSHRLLECESVVNTYQGLSLNFCRGPSSAIYYSDYCYGNNSHLFGCIGLRNKQYCIFNKQYTKEDYEIMVGKIIRHMMQPRRDALLARPGETFTERGEFFHPSLSPFGYNETVAQEYYPLTQDVIARNGHGTKGSGSDEAIHNHVGSGLLRRTSQDSNAPRNDESSSQGRQRFGYHRSTYESPKPVSDKVIQGSELPDIIEEVEDSILQYAIACEVSGKLFRIQSAELAFYRKHHIPLPRKHPDVRHMERMSLRK